MLLTDSSSSSRRHRHSVQNQKCTMDSKRSEEVRIIAEKLILCQSHMSSSYDIDNTRLLLKIQAQVVLIGNLVFLTFYSWSCSPLFAMNVFLIISFKKILVLALQLDPSYPTTLTIEIVKNLEKIIYQTITKLSIF